MPLSITSKTAQRVCGCALLIVIPLISACAAPKPAQPAPRNLPTGPFTAVSLAAFSDSIKHWHDRFGSNYASYRPEQIVEIADNIVLYQRDNGGWIENQDPTRVLSENERAAIEAQKGNATGSFDNRNVYSQIEYLSAAYQQTRDALHRDAALKGLEYVMAMQHKSCGGWPHTVPSKDAYQSYITMADEVTSGVLRMLRKAASGAEPFAYLPDAMRQRTREALERGDACVLKLQVIQQGRPTGWAGQYNPADLLPAKGRAFELPAIVSQETVEMLRYLMSIPSPSPAVIRAVEAGTDWLERSRIKGMRLETITLEKPIRYRFHTATTDRRLIEDPKAPPLWARFYDLKDNSVVLADRDGRRVATYADVSHERRTGYGWYGDWPVKLVESEYPAWRIRLGLGNPTR